MNFNSFELFPLFEKTLVRISADFESTKNSRSIISELSKELKTKVSEELASAYNFQIKKTEDDVYHLITPFLLYRDSRLVLINLLKWIERNATTKRNHNLIIDCKYIGVESGPFKGTLFFDSIKIENIDKLKFILEFDEDKIYKEFPSRKNYYLCQSIKRFETPQKFIPQKDSVVDPKFYTVPDTKNSGINFDCLIEGFLRMQYLGGEDYEKKIEQILYTLNQFCVTAIDSTINKNLTEKNIKTFNSIIDINDKIRNSYYDYYIFQKNYPKVKFTVNLMDNKKILETYYQSIRGNVYDIFSNLSEFKSMELNYDTSVSVFQIRNAAIDANTINNVEFINCELNSGNFYDCNFYDCKIKNSFLSKCNLYLETTSEKSTIIDSFINRTVKIEDCEIDGMNGVFNGYMKSGIFRKGKIGIYGKISKTTKMIQYNPIKPGYIVYGDDIIIPTKNFKRQ